MNRRAFAKIAAAGAAFAAIRPAAASGPEAMVSIAGVARGASDDAVAKAAREAASAATDFSWLSKGDAVVIKPVQNSGNAYPATTNPAGLAAMVRLLKEKGAGRVIVCDMSGIEWVKLEPDKMRGSTRKLMENSGLAKAALAAGAELHLPEEDGWDAFFEDGMRDGKSWKAGLMMPRILKEADHVVLMPRCSRHVLAGTTLGLKAAVGWWRTDTRLEYHRDASNFHAKTAEANTAGSLMDKQRLVLTVATSVQTTFGPDSGFKVEPETGIAFASDSIVAHDMVSMAWFLTQRKATPESDKESMVKDPNSSDFMVENGNRLVVYWLGGAAEAGRAQKLTRNDVNAIKDDKTLARAFQVFGGVPNVNFKDANGAVTDEVKKAIEGELARAV